MMHRLRMVHCSSARYGVRGSWSPDWGVVGVALAGPLGGTTTFIAGNHDFAFACYLGCVEWGGCSEPLDLDATKNSEYKRGYWPHPVEGGGGMHYQGRRWGGGDGQDIYEARPTFESYGVPCVVMPRDVW
jgi:hypothetical protein